MFVARDAASVALMAAVTWRFGLGVLANPDAARWMNGFAWVLAFASLVLLVRYHVNSAWLVLGGGVAGWLMFLLRGE